MAHNSYRTLQHWNQWLTQQFLGACLLEAERQLLTGLLGSHFGKYALLIGVPGQADLLKAASLSSHLLVSPLVHHNEKFDYYIEGDLHELPILTGSIDLVLLPHTLERIDNPRQLLAEACRIIKPEGLIVICGFNPYGLWGIKRLLSKRKTMPWSGNFIHSNTIENWLHLADFEMEQQKRLLFRPPIHRKTLYQRLHFLERMGSQCCPLLGGAYILLARAKVIPLTPIRLKWKQQLSGRKIPAIISGHHARES